MTPEVSIGLPVRNGEEFLARTIDSVLSQTYQNFELVICDNASTDRTAEISHSFADQRVRYLRSDTYLGAAANFNKVFHAADEVTEYFCWARSGDVWEREFLSTHLSLLAADPYAVLSASPVKLINGDGDKVGMWDDNFDTTSLDLLGRFHVTLWRLRYKPNAAVSIYGLLRKSALLKTALAQVRYGFDWILLAELSLYGNFVRWHEPLMSRRVKPSTYTTQDQWEATTGKHEKPFKGPFRPLAQGVISTVLRSQVPVYLKPILALDALYSMARKF